MLSGTYEYLYTEEGAGEARIFDLKDIHFQCVCILKTGFPEVNKGDEVG